MAENIIQFPGAKPPEPKPEAEPQQPTKPVQLNPDQEKAIRMIVSGEAFVCIGIRPTDTGADFITACYGDATDLRNAEDHLPAVIHRLLVRKGIIS